MARLLFLIDHHTMIPGDCVVAKPDGHEWSVEEKRLFLQVDLPGLSVEDAAAKYLEPGVPKELRDAVTAAEEDLKAAVLAGDPSVIAQAKQNVRSMLATAEGYPRRALRIDVSALPQKECDKVRAHWTERKAGIAQIAAAEAVAFQAAVETKLGRAVKEDEKHDPMTVLADLAAIDERGAEAVPVERRKFARDLSKTGGKIHAIRCDLIAAKDAAERAMKTAIHAGLPLAEAHVTTEADLDKLMVPA